MTTLHGYHGTGAADWMELIRNIARSFIGRVDGEGCDWAGRSLYVYKHHELRQLYLTDYRASAPAAIPMSAGGALWLHRPQRL